MTVDLWKSLFGGILIGAGAVTLLLLNGKIAGISGILDNAVRGVFGPYGWRLGFLIGLILVAAPAFWYVRKRRATAPGETAEPGRSKIDAPLIAGSAVFGIGWGLSGICPGPGLLLLTGGSLQSIVFVGGVIVGFILLRLLQGRPAQPSP